MKKFFYPLLFFVLLCTASVSAQTSRLYVGKYTGQNEKGLHVVDVDLAKGKFTLVSENDAGNNPSYICISKKRNIIYAVNEVGRFNGVRSGSVTALKLDPASGKTEKINDLAVPNGGPCYISISPEEDYLFVANYGGGSLAVVKLDANGAPSAVSDTIVFRGEEGTRSHAHMIAPGPGGKKVYLTDLGFDKVSVYDLDHASGKLKNTGSAKLAKGSGPRHFTFSKDGSKMYVINELNSTMTVFSVAKDGNLTEIQTISTLPEGFTEKSYCADVHLSKDSKFLYGSNRGHNSIVTYKVGKDGKLTVAGYTPCGGEWPRNFTLDPTGKYLLVGNQNSGNIAVFALDKKSGLPLAPSKEYKIKGPACLKFIE